MQLSILRTKKEITQEQLSNIVGCSEIYIRKIEAGERLPSVKLAKKIASVLEFDWTKFFDDDENFKETG
ncbi:helix-turn-helix domain-containing protein [Alkalibaculum sp. M08DMB]|uniref:Helix-turn-helix domain-containing protein n=1 Tax=Alkalibaculum sporogenes TaxID=2655001 RepID=A0A6A7KAX2_9FIRM|nr:helix-turn-helix transcriptional regulator [Alkalibaculum sporogenes]MPW26431.1 helix-turn-helix domain-containing protein [Alkalibaculum sporogenes]